MKVLVLGSSGQLGSHLRELLGQAVFWDKAQADFRNPLALRKLAISANPDVIINAAAYTAVDKAEEESDLAEIVNHDAPQALAEAANACDALLVHFSTDYVFDGFGESPYQPDDVTNPTGVYGRTKLAGDLAVAEYCDKYWIFRVGWVFSEHGNNFVKTMLRLAQERDKVSVVDDQRGRPTYAGSIARMCVDLLGGAQVCGLPSGTYHIAGGPIVSWYQFAREIFEQAYSLGLLAKRMVVEPITTAEYPTLAPRPPYSALRLSPDLSEHLSFELDWIVDLTSALRAMSLRA